MRDSRDTDPKKVGEKAQVVEDNPPAGFGQKDYNIPAAPTITADPPPEVSPSMRHEKGMIGTGLMDSKDFDEFDVKKYPQMQWATPEEKRKLREHLMIERGDLPKSEPTQLPEMRQPYPAPMPRTMAQEGSIPPPLAEHPPRIEHPPQLHPSGDPDSEIRRRELERKEKEERERRERVGEKPAEQPTPPRPGTQPTQPPKPPTSPLTPPAAPKKG